jgi:general secretion pathway protein G
MKKRNGFTLVEILIVVVILGILAAIVIPQFSDASEQAKLSSLVSDLQTVRSQIQLYKAQHHHADGTTLPGTVTGVDFETAMTSYTVKAGTEASPQSPGAGIYGPYLLKIPQNPFTDACSVATSGTPGGGGITAGWIYNSTTGAFNAHDTTEHAGY